MMLLRQVNVNRIVSKKHGNLVVRMIAAGFFVTLFQMHAGLAAKKIATVNSRDITDEAFARITPDIGDSQREALLKDKVNYKRMTEQLIDQEVLLIEAERQKLDQTEEFKRLVDNFRKNALANKLVENAIAPKLSDPSKAESNAKKYFESNKSRYRTDKLHIQHILLESLDEAKEILKEVRDPKADFQKVAERVSRDPSAKSNRGDLGLLMRDQMTPEVSDIAFSAEIGKVVGPVKSAFGYHLLKITDIEAGSQPGFEDVKGRVMADYRASLIRDFVSGLREKADVKVIE